MSAIRLPLLTTIIAILAGQPQAMRAALRDTVNINRGWLFHAGEISTAFDWNADSCEYGRYNANTTSNIMQHSN